MTIEVKTFVSQAVNVASERFAATYGATASLDCLGSPESFSISVITVKVGSLILAKARARGMSTTHAHEEAVHILVPLAGTPFGRHRGARHLEMVAGESAAVVRPSETTQLTIKEGVGLSIHAPIKLLTDRAEQLTFGTLCVSPFYMADQMDLRAPAGAALARTAERAMDEIYALDSSGLAPLTAAGYEHVLLSLLAAAVFPGVAARFGRPSAHVAPASVRRARDYIRENADEPLDMAKLAKNLGIPIRTLQDNFSRHFGLSPRGWLMECRLERARRALRLPEGPTSVSAVAYASGFGNLGDFSVNYRKKYGESPSETLRLALQRLS